MDFIPIGLVSEAWRKTTPGAEAESPSSHPLGAGTYAGLRAMLAHAAQPAFRARAGGIWDRMMLGQDGASGAG